MFKKIIKWLTSQPSSLESYILSKNPTNAAEVDYWSVQYSYSSQKGAWL
jgi:hypothetical protein